MVPAELRTLVRPLAGLVVLAFGTRAAMQLEILALMPQLTACREATPRLKPADRLLWARLSASSVCELECVQLRVFHADLHPDPLARKP